MRRFSMKQERSPGRDLAVLYLSMTLTRVGFGVIIILFPAYLLGVTDIELAIALALYPVLEAFSAIPMGRLCDTRGRKRVFVFALAYVALLTGTIGITRNLYFVATVHALMGIGAAGVTVSSLTMITDATGGLHTYFASQLGYAFAATGGGIAVALLVSTILLREPLHQIKPEPLLINPLKALDARTKAILPVWLALTAMIGIAFYLPRALSRLGFESTTTSYVLFVGVAGLGVGSVGFGALSDRIGREKVLLIGVVGLLGLLLSLATTLSGGATIDSLVQHLYLIAPFALATSALVPSILATVGDRARQEMRGSAMGIYSVMLSGGIAFGTLVAGFAHTMGGLPAILYAGAIIFLAACLVSLFLIRRVKA
ncbi:MAG: MFS transporter [Thaumarchaeota archaeon]|nr:MAG: MFS transporter [Nitrososphaerota archaeon]